MRYSEIVELYDPQSSFPLEWDDSFAPQDYHATAYDRQGRSIDISFVQIRPDITEIEFQRGGSFDVTGRGDAPQVFATVLEAIKQYLSKQQPKIIIFSAKEGSRYSLYQSLVKRFAGASGYQQFDISKLSDRAKDKIGASGTNVIVLRKSSPMSEAFDKPYKGKWEHGDESHDMLVKLPDGSNLSIMFSMDYGAYGDEEWTVEFWRNNSQEVTGEGDQQRIFATVLNAIQKFIKKYHPERLRFSANKDVEPGQKSMSRTNLYNRLVQRYANSLGYSVDVDDFADTTVYNLHTMNEGVAEARGLAPTKPYDDLLANMGFFMSLNTVKIQQDAVDNTAQQELAVMQQQFRKPILNGMTFFDVHKDMKLTKDPRVAPILLKYVYDMLGYIEPRIKKYVQPAQQQKYLARLDQIKNDYRAAVAQVSEQTVAENFHDGRNPQDKGDSKRYGVPTKASVSTLRKVAKQGGRKGQLAHWMANMKAGRAKARRKG